MVTKGSIFYLSQYHPFYCKLEKLTRPKKVLNIENISETKLRFVIRGLDGLSSKQFRAQNPFRSQQIFTRLVVNFVIIDVISKRAKIRVAIIYKSQLFMAVDIYMRTVNCLPPVCSPICLLYFNQI